MSQVRVRFAPSPTGFFHIGSARTALFNWLYARHTGGVFVLRIEDTDKERNSDEYLNLIYDSLKWLGLNWDEGPQVGGPYGPYLQSQRAHVYAEYLEKLKAAGRTYEKDGAIYFKLLGERTEVYDEHRKKTVTKVKNEPTIIDDQIRGRVERIEDEDFVIVRSDGNPVFHFVNVVDDIAMKITHVIRGEDHLSNSSKHVELFKAFGAPVPAYAHIPLILKQNGPGKMSKRDQGALIEEYQRRGFLSDALVNFLCLLGWSPKNDQEKMPITEIIRLFDLPGVTQSNARFDDRKLSHMNMAYLHDLAGDRYVALARGYLERAGFFAQRTVDGAYLHDVLTLCQPKVRAIEDLPGFIGYFFDETFPIEAKAHAKIMGKGDPKARLRELATALATADFNSDAALEQVLQTLATTTGNGTGDYIHPGRLAVSGMSVGPSYYGLLRVLGRERVLKRIEHFLATN